MTKKLGEKGNILAFPLTIQHFRLRVREAMKIQGIKLSDDKVEAFAQKHFEEWKAAQTKKP